MHVKIIVLNSVLHDARVIKEANSLAAAGHDVSIIGLFDKRSTAPDHVLPSGVRVHLCQPRLEEATRAIMRYAQLWILALLVLVILLLLMSPLSAGMISLMSSPRVHQVLVVSGLFIVCALFASIRAHKVRQKIRNSIEQGT